MNYINKIFHWVHIIFVLIAEVLILALVAIVSINVVSRGLYGFEALRPIIKNAGFSWAEEIPSSVLIPLFAFFGTVIGIKENVHIDINVLPRKLPIWFENTMKLLKFSIYFILGIIFLKDGIELVRVTNISILPASNLPASLQYIILPIISIPLMYEGIMGVLNVLFGIKKDDEHLDKLLNLEGEDDGK